MSSGPRGSRARPGPRCGPRPAPRWSNTCSIAATAGLPQRAVYSASKGAVLALTRAMAADGLPDGIRVNAVHPGTADTPWIRRLTPQRARSGGGAGRALRPGNPTAGWSAPGEVAYAVLYLASPRAGSTTGAEIAVDVAWPGCGCARARARDRHRRPRAPVGPGGAAAAVDRGVSRAAAVVPASRPGTGAGLAPRGRRGGSPGADTTGETLDLLALAATSPRLAGVVGWVDLESPDVPAAVAALQTAPGGGKLAASVISSRSSPTPGTWPGPASGTG